MSTSGRIPIPNRLLIPHPVHFFKWGPETPDKRGIGNSETAHIEIAQRMAARGWEVICYAPLEDDSPREWKGVQWRTLEEIDYSLDGHWMIFRSPEMLDHFEIEHPGKQLTLVSQDEAYPGRWNDERCQKLDLMFGLCQAHCRSIESDNPLLGGKVRQSSNGIKLEAMLAAEAETPDIPRNPHRIMWASSPDRGMLNLLKVFRRVRQWVSDAELHCFYGFNNIDKLLAMGPQFDWMRKAKEEILREADQPGVVLYGMQPQPVVWQEWRKSGIIAYPTTFCETSCATLMEAQALGAIPVVSPVWALAENTMAGSMIIGDPADELTIARFAGEIYRWMSQAELAEKVRPAMMQEIRHRFDWERQVDIYEAHLLGFAAHGRLVHSQFNFQLKHSLGAKSILNVGCADDPADLKALGAVNLDSRTEDPIFHRATKADIIADCRDLPLNGDRYEVVVCGDMLEHFPPADVPGILINLKKCLEPGGRLVLTIPDDHRTVSQQHILSDGTDEYSRGVCACHDHPIPKELLDLWLAEAGLETAVYQQIECFYYKNHGVVAVSATPVTDSLDRIDQILEEANADC